MMTKKSSRHKEPKDSILLSVLHTLKYPLFVIFAVGGLALFVDYITTSSSGSSPLAFAGGLGVIGAFLPKWAQDRASEKELKRIRWYLLVG